MTMMDHVVAVKSLCRLYTSFGLKFISKLLKVSPESINGGSDNTFSVLQILFV